MGRQFNGTGISGVTKQRPARPFAGRFCLTWRALGGAVVALGLAGQASVAQEARIMVAEGAVQGGTAVAQPSDAAAAQPAQEGQKPGQEGAETKPEQKAEGEAQKEDKPKEGESAAGEPVTRPDKPSFSPDPAELDIKPDEDGNIRFSFHGQSWPDVLNWLAGVSGLSLDWQEMPGDYLNLTTHREYSITEARDLINRHLLSRGFTLIVEGEVLHVVKMEKLDPSMVQHVPPLDLDSHLPSTVVKTTFDLPKDLPAEQAVEDVKQLLSTHGKTKVQALKATNRIFAIDSVANLLDVRRMITAERQELEGHTVPRTFVLRHARATDVVKTLKELLGMEAGGPQMPMNPQQMQQMMQQMQQQAQQQQQKGAAAPEEEKTYLVAVPRHNVILANAPPDKMEIIATTIDVLDIETASGEALLGNLHRMRRYRLVSLDPESIVTTLQEIGNLDPRTRLQADTKTRSVVAYATLADHVTIQALVDKLDGTGRRFDVIRLRRLPADQVAGTIEYMMGVKEEEDTSNQRRNYYPFYYSSMYNQQEEQPPKDSFRVDADVERNWLLLWANDAEREEVNNFLVKMGEMPAGGMGPQTVRVMEATTRTDTDAVLERLQRMWGGGNELIIQDNRPPKPEPQTAPAPAAEEDDEPLLPDEDRQTHTSVDGRRTVRFVQLPGNDDLTGTNEENTDNDASPVEPSSSRNPPQQLSAEPADGELPADWPFRREETSGGRGQPAAPVTITLTPDGRIVLNSDDPAALDRLEDLILELTPPPREYQVFQLRHADAWYVRYDLEDFFAAEMEDEGQYIRDWYGGMVRTGSQQDASRLSRKRKLTFVADSEANIIIVRGASPEQLKTIEELIAYYDKPLTDAISKRSTQVVKLHYSQARVVADAIKEVYRDLLSSRDKAFQNGQQQKEEGENRTETFVRIYDYGAGDEGSQKSSPVKASFQGALSVGVDEIANTLIISAQEELIDNVIKIAQYLDEQARPTATVRMHRVRNLDASALQGMLARTASDPWTGGKRPQGQGRGEQQEPGGEQPQQPAAEGQQPAQQAQGEGTTTAAASE